VDADGRGLGVGGSAGNPGVSLEVEPTPGGSSLGGGAAIARPPTTLIVSTIGTTRPAIARIRLRGVKPFQEVRMSDMAGP
jgi:hypothetical protein